MACVKSLAPKLEHGSLPATFQCSAGNLIAEAFHCDGIPQCIAGHDEENCPPMSHTSCSLFDLHTYQDDKCFNHCPSLYIPCADGRCIPLDALCNGFMDCPGDGWDESFCPHSFATLHLNRSKVTQDLVYACANGHQNYSPSTVCVFSMLLILLLVRITVT